jgi:betaine lipid synthase
MCENGRVRWRITKRYFLGCPPDALTKLSSRSRQDQGSKHLANFKRLAGMGAEGKLAVEDRAGGGARERAIERLGRDVAARVRAENIHSLAIAGSARVDLLTAISNWLGSSPTSLAYVALIHPNTAPTHRLHSVHKDPTCVAHPVHAASFADALDSLLLSGFDMIALSFALSTSCTCSPYCLVDSACASLSRPSGALAACDYYVSRDQDHPLRQMGLARRLLCRFFHERRGYDPSPAGREYLEYKLERDTEYNGNGRSPISILPLISLRRPHSSDAGSGRRGAAYFTWIGRQPGTVPNSKKEEQQAGRRPSLFPPTFLYSLSWEDPRRDEQVLKTQPGDVCLTLASGGCNSLDLLLQGADAVYAVDVNPAQGALLELKTEAVRRLSYEDTWRMFGTGIHPNIDSIYHRELAPFLSQRAQNFWDMHLYYFKDGFYYHGAMGKGILAFKNLASMLGLATAIRSFIGAETLEEQKRVWDSNWLVRRLQSTPPLVSRTIASVIANRAVLWWIAGVPSNQANLIADDGRNLAEYLSTVFDGLARGSHIRTENYFYHAVLAAHFNEDNCPRFLRNNDYDKLRQPGVLDRLRNITGGFEDELSKRMYTKVILMDHVDWFSNQEATRLADALARSVSPGGRVIWRSASKWPPYVNAIAGAGFDVERCDCHHDRLVIDRVAMYASFWVGIRRSDNRHGSVC